MLRATTTAVRAVGLVAIVATGCSTNSTNFDRDDRQGGEASQWQLFEQKKTAGGVEQAEAILILVLGGGKKITTFSEAFWSKQKNIRILCEDSSLALKTERRTVISVDVGEPIQPEGRLTKQSDGVGRYDGKFSVRLAFDQGPLTPERWNESSLDWIASPKDGPQLDLSHRTLRSC